MASMAAAILDVSSLVSVAAALLTCAKAAQGLRIVFLLPQVVAVREAMELAGALVVLAGDSSAGQAARAATTTAVAVVAVRHKVRAATVAAAHGKSVTGAPEGTVVCQEDLAWEATEAREVWGDK